MTPFKLPVRIDGFFLADAEQEPICNMRDASQAEQAFVIQAINNVPLHAALAEYYAANEAQDKDRLYEARKTIHHLLEQA